MQTREFCNYDREIFDIPLISISYSTLCNCCIRFLFFCFTLFAILLLFLRYFFFDLPKFQWGKFSFVVFAVFQQQQLVSLCTCRMFCELKPSETQQQHQHSRKGRTEHEHEYKHERRARERLYERVKTSLLSCE